MAAEAEAEAWLAGKAGSEPAAPVPVEGQAPSEAASRSLLIREGGGALTHST